MDVKPAPASTQLAADTVGPVMDVVPPVESLAVPPPSEKTEPETSPPVAEKTVKKIDLPKPVQPKQPGNNVTSAIFATVIIVLGLAALAVYAYLKQNQ